MTTQCIFIAWHSDDLAPRRDTQLVSIKSLLFRERGVIAKTDTEWCRCFALTCDLRLKGYCKQNLRETRRKASDSLTCHAFKKFSITLPFTQSCLVSHSTDHLAISQAANFTRAAHFENHGHRVLLPIKNMRKLLWLKLETAHAPLISNNYQVTISTTSWAD